MLHDEKCALHDNGVGRSLSESPSELQSGTEQVTSFSVHYSRVQTTNPVTSSALFFQKTTLARSPSGAMSALAAAAASAAAALYWAWGRRVGTSPGAREALSVWAGGERPAGLLERWFSASHQTGVMRCFSFVLHCEGAHADVARWRQAARRVALSLPAARVAFDDSDAAEGPRLRESDAAIAPPVRSVPRSGPRDWERVVERDSLEPFEGVCWRVTLVQGGDDDEQYEIVLSAHHGAFDGRAVAHLARCLLREHAGVVSGRAAPAARVPLDAAHSSPPMDALVDIRPTAGFVARLLFNHKVVRPLGLSPDRAYLGADSPPHAREARVLGGRLSRADTAALLARCCEEGITAHQALLAAAEIAAAAAAGGAARVRSGTSMDARRLLRRPVPDDHFGAYVCEVAREGDVRGDEGVRAVSARSARPWLDRAAVLGAVRTIGVLEHAGPSWWKLLRELRGHRPSGRAETVCVTNLGVLDLGGGGGVRVTAAHHAQTKAGQGPVWIVACATAGGVLAYALSHTRPNTDDGQAAVFDARFRQALLEL